MKQPIPPTTIPMSTTTEVQQRRQSKNPSMTTNTMPNRRRKRRSSSSASSDDNETKEPSSWITVPIILSAGFLLSMLLSSAEYHTNEDLSLSPLLNEQRRQLRNNNNEGVIDLGVEENVWRRQLRARKDREGRGGAGGGQRRRRRQQDQDVQLRPDVSRRTMADDIMKEDNGKEDGDGRPMRRMAVIPRYTDKHHFEECIGKTIEECQTAIDTYVTAHPDQFNNQTTLLLDIRKIRELTDESYYKVVLRTNTPGTKVYGIFDDGMVYYPWPWRVNGVDTNIGPWDCDEGGNLMTPEACCAMIQADVPSMDDNGNYLACFVEEPVGGPHNPERGDRAIVVTDSSGKVLRAPVAH